MEKKTKKSRADQSERGERRVPGEAELVEQNLEMVRTQLWEECVSCQEIGAARTVVSQTEESETIRAYMQENSVGELFEILISALLTLQPTRPLDFMIDLLGHMAGQRSAVLDIARSTGVTSEIISNGPLTRQRKDERSRNVDVCCCRRDVTKELIVNSLGVTETEEALPESHESGGTGSLSTPEITEAKQDDETAESEHNEE